MAFLAAGGLFALPPLAAGVSAVTGTEIVVSPAVIFMFLVVAFVGLLGLYPALVERDARLANASLGQLAVTTAMLLPAIVLFLYPSGPPVGEALALAIVVTVAVGSTLTVLTFGITSLRTGAHSRLVGGFLLVMAASMSLMIAVMLVFGHSAPDWVSVVVNGLVATSLGTVGSVLRTTDLSTENPDAASTLVGG